MLRSILVQFITLFCLSWSAAYMTTHCTLHAQEIKAPYKASVYGKYVTLLRVIEASQDKDEYGTFCDWGYWFGTEYAGSINNPSGFWVYVYPNWYIWERLATERNLDPQASVHGKYRVLMHILKVPEDIRDYGCYYDWGFSEEYSYAGYDNLTPGYWVYLEPNWYVWADTEDVSNGT